MKNFKTPLAIEGSKEDLEALVPELEKLGYKNSGWNCGATDLFLITTRNSVWGGLYGYFKNSGGLPISFSASNKDLVLALAAMVDSEELHAGEWCVFRGGIGDSSFTRGKLYKAHHDGWEALSQFKDDKGSENGYSCRNKVFFKKATKEEIINHFASVNRTSMGVKDLVASYGTENKKIIGYKVKEGVSKEAAAAATGFPDFSDVMAFYYNSLAADRAKERGILDLLFEPVYESEFKIGDWVYVIDGAPGSRIANKLTGQIVTRDEVVKNIKKDSDGFHINYAGEVIDSPCDMYIKSGNKYYGLCNGYEVRKATPEEIKQAQKPKEKTIIVKAASGEFEVKVGKDKIVFNQQLFSSKQLRDILTACNIMVTKIRAVGVYRNDSYDVKINSIDIGCKKGIPLSTIQEIVDAYNEING